MHDSQIIVPRQLELLERLGEEVLPQRTIAPPPPHAQSYHGSNNVRFSPQRSVTTDATIESNIDSTVAVIDQSTTTEPPIETAIQTNDNDNDDDLKCNSHVLKKLMLDVSLTTIVK
jgi:hypothetical protein